MRRTISISVSEELHDYIQKQCRFSTVSEYIRSLIREERQRRADYSSRPIAAPRQMNDSFAMANVLDQVDKLREMLERS